jgi:hypothetical protein
MAKEIDQANQEIQAWGAQQIDAVLKASKEELQALLEQTGQRLSDWADPAGFAGKISAVLDHAASDKVWRDLAGTFNAATTFASDYAKPLSALEAALNAGDVAEVAEALNKAAVDFTGFMAATVKHAEHAIVADLKTEISGVRDLLSESVPTELELTRLLASGLNTDTLSCTREALGFYYTKGQQVLDVTRSSAILNDLGQASLNALSAMVPFDRLRERLLPQLENLDFSDLFPDLGGLKLEHLFPELKIVKDRLGEYDWLQVRHGFDKDRMTAWSNVEVDKPFETETTLFALPPVSVSLDRARLRAHMRVELDGSGARTQDVWASIKADWKINLSGKALVTISEGELIFANDGRFDFRFDSQNIVLADELKFITEALSKLFPQDEGLTIAPLLPAGISATLAMPLPDIGTGAFTITGVTLFCNLSLAVGAGFEIRTGFWLSRPDRPFGLAVLFLGGGGWVGVDVAYRPPGDFETRLSIGVSAGAFVAFNLGFARGSAGLLFTAGVDFYSGGQGRQGSTAVSLGLLIWGEFSILCIASAYLRLHAVVSYTDQGGMEAVGRVTVSIRISFFYTLRVNRTFKRVFSGGGAKLSLLTAGFSPQEIIDLHYATLDLPV